MVFGKTPIYLLKPLSYIQKAFLSKLRLSALPLRNETGRYERPRLDVNDRLCLVCKDGISVEDEEHLLFHCEKYSALRQEWKIRTSTPDNFCLLDKVEKFKFIFNDSNNIKITAQYLIDCFSIRSTVISSL